MKWYLYIIALLTLLISCVDESSEPDLAEDVEICPRGIPQTGEKCNHPGLYCEYTSAIGCDMKNSSQCIDEEWVAYRVISCLEEPEPLECQPFGRWSVELVSMEDDYSEESYDSFKPFEFTLSEGEDGELISDRGGWFEPEACEYVVNIGLSYYELSEYEMQGGGSESVSQLVTLVLNSSDVTGTVRIGCSGECGWQFEGVVRATHL